MKFVQGMGWVSTDGRVLPIAGQKQPNAEGVANVYAENATLRRLVLMFGQGSIAKPDSARAIFDALLDYEMLYGRLDRSPETTPVLGLLQATKGGA